MAKSYTARPPGTKSVRLDLSEEMHRQLRVMAAQAGLPMSQYVRQLVEGVIRKTEPARKKT
jgi:hypothetical protein